MSVYEPQVGDWIVAESPAFQVRRVSGSHLHGDDRSYRRSNNMFRKVDQPIPTTPDSVVRWSNDIHPEGRSYVLREDGKWIGSNPQSKGFSSFDQFSSDYNRKLEVIFDAGAVR